MPKSGLKKELESIKLPKYYEVSSIKSTGKIETRRSPSRSTKKPIRRSSPVLREEIDDDSIQRSATRKSPTRSNRTRSPVRKSPSRTRSPARKIQHKSRDRSKTSNEKKKSPPRSPSRSKKPETRQTAKAQKRKIEVINLDSDSDGLEYVRKEKPHAAVRGRSRIGNEDKHTHEVIDDYLHESLISRRSARLSQQHNERIVHLKDTEVLKKNLIEYSDDDEIQTEILPSSKNLIAAEFGGTVGVVILMLLSPLFVIGIITICDNHDCTWNELYNVPINLNIDYYIDSISFVGCCAFLTVFALLNALPFGGVKVTDYLNKQGRLEYCFNSGFITLITLIITIILECYGIRFYGFLYEKYLKLTVSSIIAAIFISICAYIKSYYVPISALNPNIIGKSSIYNFYMGREIHPKLFGVIDMKFFVCRFSLISLVLLNLSIFYKNLGEDFKLSDILELNFNTTLAINCLIHVIYVIDAMIFEHIFVTSFEIQTEGFGFMFASGYMTSCFVLASINKYILESDIICTPLFLAYQTITFLAGLILSRLSDIQKHTFKMNPYSKAVMHLKTIPSASGKRILASGYWGIVRHPNYLGKLIILGSLFPLTINTPYSFLILLNALLIITRTYRITRRCKAKYGIAWDKYCEQVKYAIIPKIF